MGTVVDLSIPIEETMPRWKVQFVSSFGGTAYKTSTVTMPLHLGTHLDAPLHYVAGGLSIEQFPLELALTSCQVLDLTYVGKNEAINVPDIAARFPAEHVDTILLRTDWPRRYWRTSSFWADSPYLTGAAAAWLAERRIRIIGYDFPQDRAIRDMASGTVTAADFDVHQEILSRGVWQIEYLINLDCLPSDRVELWVCPLALVGLEASPVRVLARA